MVDILPDPSKATQSVLPTAKFDPRAASGDDMGAQVGRAIGDVAEEGMNLVNSVDRYRALYQEDQDRLENFNLEKSYTDFTAAEQERLVTAAAAIPAGGKDFTKTATTTFDKASQDWLSKVPARLRPKWDAQMARTRAAFSTGALTLEMKERESYYKNTVTTELNRFANGIGQMPNAYDIYRQKGIDFIEASGMSPADKNAAKTGWAANSANVLAQTMILKDPGGFKKSIEKGDPRFEDLDADRVRSLVSAADREQRQRSLEAKQAANLANTSAVNTLMLDIHDGKAGQADIDNARKKGWLRDASDVFRAESVLKSREEEAGSMNFVNTALAIPNFPFNPYDPAQKKGVNAAVKAAGGSPQAALDIWTKTGILGDAGAVALRGALVSTDPQRVTVAANVAGNMMVRNPNAFAGVEGRTDIEKSALTYNHYVDDLGMTREAAGERVAQQNDPGYKSKIKVTDTDVADFQKKLRKSTAVNDLISKKKGWFSTPQVAGIMRQSVVSDFSEFATDYYLSTGDAAGAQSYASKKLDGLYGVSNGQVMKYPPEKSYPPMGDKPSYDYIYHQAAYDVKAATGKKVAPRDIVLTPLPVATSEAWRANRPAPYQIHYYENIGGQRVLQTVPRAAFVADPSIEAKRLTTERGKLFEDERKAHEEADRLRSLMNVK